MNSTDDAYANGNMININSAISGSVVAFYADDTDLVVEGQLLAALGPTPYQVIYNRELAALAAEVLQIRQLYDNVQVNQALVKNREAALSKAKYDYENRLQLIGSLAISNEDFIHSRDDLTIAETNLRQAQEQLKAAESAAGPTSPEQHPRIEQQKGNVRKAYYDLQHCSLFAPATGYIAQRQVEVGQWVSPKPILWLSSPPTMFGSMPIIRKRSLNICGSASQPPFGSICMARELNIKAKF